MDETQAELTKRAAYNRCMSRFVKFRGNQANACSSVARQQIEDQMKHNASLIAEHE